jgi:oligopeptide/dipeptide ABC transporter ATP-binding protein
MQATPPLLSVEELRVQFTIERSTIHAVNGISYTLAAGESLGIVGESGSGKSVSALAVMGLIKCPPGKIAGGRILFKGRDLLTLPRDEMRRMRAREIAMVFQDPMTSLNPVITVGLQLREVMVSQLGMSKPEAEARAAELLDLVGIANAKERLKDHPFQFSGGQRQRIMIAIALACNPSLLIADEPTTALDVTIQAQVVDLVRDLQQSLGTAIIWISHNLGLVAGLVSRVIVMYGGTIVEEAPVDELYERPLHPYTLGLLESVPSVDRAEARLASIEGLPPDLRHAPVGCPFAARCPYVLDRCRAEQPPLVTVQSNHQSACWRWEEVASLSRFGEPM